VPKLVPATPALVPAVPKLVPELLPPGAEPDAPLVAPPAPAPACGDMDAPLLPAVVVVSAPGADVSSAAQASTRLQTPRPPAAQLLRGMSFSLAGERSTRLRLLMGVRHGTAGILKTYPGGDGPEVFTLSGSRRFRPDTLGCEDPTPVRCCLATFGALLSLFCTALPAAAAEPAPPTPFVLSWQAPEGCPSQSAVEEEIASSLSHLRGRGLVDVAAEVTTRADEPGYRLRVKVIHAGQVGERVLPIDDCNDTSRAAALLVALSVENPPPPPPPPKLVPPPPPPPPPAPLAWTIGLGPRLALGIAPEMSAGLGASISFSHSFWRFSLRGAAFAPSNHTVAGSQVGGRFQLFTGGAFACAGYPGTPLTFYGCLGGRYDHLTATGFGATTNGSASTDIGSPAAGITLEWSLTKRVRLRTELEAGYPLGEAHFVIKNVGERVHEVDAVRGEAGLELAVAF
jgi:hypothetical protein